MNPASLQQSVRARARDFYLAELRAARAIDDAEIERKCAALLSRLLEAGADDDRLTVSDSSPESQAIRQVFPSGLPQLQAVHQFVRTSGQYVPPIPSGIVGESAALQRVIETASCVARSRIPVLVTGETGVGKE